MAEFSSNNITRMPPQNIDAEKSVLGSLMLDPKAMSVVVDILLSDDFYANKHGLIYAAMLDLYNKKEPIDILSVSNKLKEKNQFEPAGGNTYLAEIVNCVPTASNVKHYADIVQKKSVLRDLIESSGHISQLGYSEDHDLDILLDEAEKKIFSIARYSSKQKFGSLKANLIDAWERFEKLHKSKGEMRGVSSGFADLDNLLAGFQKSDLIIIAARPSVGKSALALDIARNVAAKNVPVGIFSLEMSVQSLVDRMLASEAHVDSWKLRTGRLSSEDEFRRVRDALDKLSTVPIYIDDESSMNIMQMRAKARRLQAEHGLGLLVVDYLQLMVPRQNNDNMVQQITEISRSLKGLARELDVPIIALSQLSRTVETRNPPIPKLHDLRDSGSIEQDADVVIFIYREDRHKPDTERKNIADIFVEKHRNGPTGKIELYFNPDKVSFSSIEKGDFGSI
ncbi:MAG: replicative DNA helicase [Candidatus Terrybacteria bacterium CG10_big_fil_rev_8_21_14_0_10_41_10]|uniref:Replicative DNA helicase n=1 Tax=Candidatus Terrybacteria bacterium CG10_big_fil_rev_8_21_14_0_10_41_10 TaxID=1975026 RepID=A0A2M8LAS8_9BACT|nr:MAG: replicative DNA helicase [Candidatus Terrybacteria bacterium CG10_big_fil_rev_8_21_14_0_10_41_10]